jgi:hypothetical protein
VKLGFCLPAEAERRLKNDPPAEIDEFTDAVFREEGMDPTSPRNRNLRKQVRAMVELHFKDYERSSSPTRSIETPQ